MIQHPSSQHLKSLFRGEGLYEGLDWLSNTLKTMKRSGEVTSVGI